MVWEQLCALLGQGCSPELLWIKHPTACSSMTLSAGPGVSAGEVWKTRTIPAHCTSLLISMWWVLKWWTSASQGTVANKHLHGFEKFLDNSLKINLSWTIINSSRAGFALGWLCSVRPCVLHCYAANDVHWLHKHLCTSSVTTLLQDACLGFAWVCAKEFCPK